MSDASDGATSDGPSGPWGVERLSDWFTAFHATDDARRRSRAAAARRGVPDLSDDLHHEWFLSVCTTLERVRSGDGAVPVWIASEEAATAYVLRALDNDAVDAARRRSREPEVRRPRHADDRDDLEPGVDDEGLARADLDQALTQVVRDLNDHLRDGTGGCPGCPSELTVRICLGVVARLRDPRRRPLADQLRGGTTEWDQLVYEVMAVVAPERVATTEDGRMAERTRQAKRRCGGCARQLLDDLLGRHLDGGMP